MRLRRSSSAWTRSGAARNCASAGAVSRGKARGLRRYRCKACGRTFGALTGTALSGLHYKERWLSFDEALAKGETIVESAERCGIAPSAAHRWRHRFLKAVRQAPDRLRGIESPQTRPLARAGAGPGRRRPHRREPQLHPADSQHQERHEGSEADPRPRRLARLRRQQVLSACRGSARHPAREHSAPRSKPSAMCGSSPRGRGTSSSSPTDTCRARFIPARAGNMPGT